jgi:hypothetical protein
MNLDDYIIIPKTWNGIEFEIRWYPDCIGFDDGTSMAHLEIESLDRAPLPITETGYKSHFVGKEVVDQYGGPETYVDAWFASVMLTPQGRTTLQAARQLSLF